MSTAGWRAAYVCLTAAVYTQKWKNFTLCERERCLTSVGIVWDGCKVITRESSSLGSGGCVPVWVAERLQVVLLSSHGLWYPQRLRWLFSSLSAGDVTRCGCGECSPSLQRACLLILMAGSPAAPRPPSFSPVAGWPLASAGSFSALTYSEKVPQACCR